MQTDKPCIEQARPVPPDPDRDDEIDDCADLADDESRDHAPRLAEGPSKAKDEAERQRGTAVDYGTDGFHLTLCSFNPARHATVRSRN